jgi:hypothetical protein
LAATLWPSPALIAAVLAREGSFPVLQAKIPGVALIGPMQVT